MSYFGDVLDAADKLHDFEIEDPDKVESIKQSTLKIKSSGDKSAISHALDFKGDACAAAQITHKTVLDYKLTKDQDVKLQVDSKEVQVEFNNRFADLIQQGSKASVQLEAKFIPGKDTWSGKAEFKIGGFDLGPLTPWTELQLDTNNKQKHNLTWSQNLQYQDWNAAWNLDIDGSRDEKSDSSKKSPITNIYAYLAYRGSFGNYYLRSNVYKNLVGAGTWWSNENSKQSVEVQVDTTGKKQGVLGQALFLRYGLSQKLCDGVNLGYYIRGGEKFFQRVKLEVPVGKAVKAVVTNEVDLAALYQDPKSSIKGLGFTLEVKL